ncbi:ABC transporter ATP-binding protein [Pseudoclavibacter endophyticus]|nr:ABC transporter ATP-binding protein [Pseudoclavibacter endophyticus]GGA66510.1 ABC transporter ATP-binding protein [Pseudoclavibacter endophyticus]
MKSLEIEGLSKRYTRDALAVDDLTLSLGEGKFTTLLGPSGCGKTTTLRCLAGLEVPDEGTIRYGDETFVDVRAGTFAPPNKRKLGMVFQSYALWPNRTVLGNVTYPLRLRHVRPSEARRRALDGLAAVGLDGYGDRYPHELSGGQQQRVALARGLVSASGLLLFDEPLSNLDAKLRLSMREEIRRLHDEYGYSSVYVTHDQEEALAISDNVVVMDRGRVQQAGAPHEIFARPATTWVAGFVGFDNIHDIGDVSPGEGRLAIATGGTVSIPAGMNEFVPGRSIAFRGDEVELADATHGEDRLRMRGTVVTSSYLGDAYRLGVEIAPGTRMIASIRDASRMQVPEKYLGETLELSVPMSSVLQLGGGPTNATTTQKGSE